MKFKYFDKLVNIFSHANNNSWQPLDDCHDEANPMEDDYQLLDFFGECAVEFEHKAALSGVNKEKFDDMSAFSKGSHVAFIDFLYMQYKIKSTDLPENRYLPYVTGLSKDDLKEYYAGLAVNYRDFFFNILRKSIIFNAQLQHCLKTIETLNAQQPEAQAEIEKLKTLLNNYINILKIQFNIDVSKRQRKRIPLAEAAVLCNVDEKTIRNWEKGTTLMPPAYPGRNVDELTFLYWVVGFEVANQAKKMVRKVFVRYNPNLPEHQQTLAAAPEKDIFGEAVWRIFDRFQRRFEGVKCKRKRKYRYQDPYRDNTNE